MNWKEERDLLIAQTMAFVQSVTGTAAYAPVPGEASPVTESSRWTESASFTEPASLTRPAKAKQPRETPSTARCAIDQGDFREEIRGRVAAFRAHQQLFNRDRDEYCNAMLAKVRASTARIAVVPDHASLER